MTPYRQQVFRLWEACRAVERRRLRGLVLYPAEHLAEHRALLRHDRAPFRPGGPLEGWIHEAAHLVMLRGGLTLPPECLLAPADWIFQ